MKNIGPRSEKYMVLHDDHVLDIAANEYVAVVNEDESIDEVLDRLNGAEDPEVELSNMRIEGLVWGFEARGVKQELT